MARQNFIGLVVSQGKMQKTVKVRVERKVFDKRINKELMKRKDFLVHDEGEITREGDLVRIEATRPLSKWKSFAIAEIIRNKGQQFALFESQAKDDVLKEEMQKTKEFLERREARLGHTDSQLLKDVKFLQSYFGKVNSQGGNEAQANELKQELEKIKERYGVQEFTPNTVKQLIKLDIQGVEEDLIEQKSKIDAMQGKLNDLLQEPSRCIEYLKQRGVESPELLQKNIMKNLVRKHVLKEL
ncbi:37S ribosomal protein S17, mitochondrial [Nakaseomyces glabratus]|uniref:37S ribosomal protein S17, mitochondrial n=1 Tax=Candida glabrata TaxID=5478 RepID=A0A0W0CWH7_CANGB|nr:Ribosomal protein S17 [Nakaseomyces glabratus]KAH7589685.1 Ribosomal protein S17 [Nakaseomyces glabratus]KAH7606358.1 Ribosomal protein S17 [Nakaseomyces glabratus]KTB01805.1 37S ribosomal protein S17, mitochondrial [Nakaseomyces glabratus]KTB03923.1 37S ribosomal protein S17, mitochondrial [Nakaseomyces glabratus]